MTRAMRSFISAKEEAEAFAKARQRASFKRYVKWAHEVRRRAEKKAK